MNSAAATNSALASLRLFILDYLNALTAHLNGDWGQHSQVNVTAGEFIAITSQAQPSFIPGSNTCRILASTVDTPSADFPLIIPLVSVATVEGTSFPAITTQPIGSSISSKYTLIVTATGEAPLSYQWFLNNAPIKNANLSTYTVLPLTQNSGGYTVLVTNQIGSAISSPATIAAIPPPAQAYQDPGSFSISNILFPF